MMDKEDLKSFNDTNDTMTSSFSEPYSLNVVVSLSVIYVIIFVTGILGNISTCIVIGRNRSMDTATNFYLFSLSVSDLLLLICGLPLEVYRLWKPFSYPLGELLCNAVGLISVMSANATVLTITAFTVERYIAICRPFISHKLSKLSRVNEIYYSDMDMRAVLSDASSDAIRNSNLQGEQTDSACTVKGHGVHQVFVFSSFVFFLVPMSLITILCVLIGVKLHVSHILHSVKNYSVEIGERSNGTPRYRSGASQRRVIKILVSDRSNRSNRSKSNRSNPEEGEPWFWGQQLAEGADSLTLPQSISNSSLREINQEISSEELATYLYEVTCKIIG